MTNDQRLKTIHAAAKNLQQQMSAWRRDFHQHPELSFQEVRTARQVAETLRALGLEVETGIAKTGVIVRIGEGHPAVGIRADMDALPIVEANTTGYISQNPGVMHACGHDAHTSILLGVAHILNSLPERPVGEIRLLFQPSEEAQDAEGKSGGSRMVEEGALDGLDAVIALHMEPTIPTGQISMIPGYYYAAVDSFEAEIIGQGGHGAYPHQTVDPIYMLAQVINAIHGQRARRINPVRPAVISVGAVHAGEANNVIPETVKLNGTIRSYDEEIRQQLFAELERAFGVARALGGDYKLHILPGYPATYNNPDKSAVVQGVANELLGNGWSFPEEPSMGAEDFSYMAAKVPGAMFSLGARLDTTHRPFHSPIFDIDEAALPIGAALLAETACRLLQQVNP